MNEKPTILIVDDDEANLMLMEYLLGKEKYHTITASNAELALEIINKNQIDIVLSDVMMPGMDGFELTREIRNNQKTRLIPIVLLTGLEEAQFRIRGIEAGCDDFISKPSVDCVTKPYYKEEVLTRIKMLLQMNFYRLQINEKEKFELLLNGIGDGYLLIDKEGKIEKSNIKAREWMLLSDNTDQVLFKEQIQKYFSLDDEENVYDTMPFYNMSFEIERPKTSQFDHLILECRSFPFREDYALENLLILIHDITDIRKETRVKKDFLNSFANLITNQLNKIKKLVGKKSLEGKEEVGCLMLEMELRIRQLIDYSNNVDNASLFMVGSIDVNGFLNDILQSFHPIFQTYHIDLTLQNDLLIGELKFRKEVVKILLTEVFLMSINRQSREKQTMLLSTKKQNSWLKVTVENVDFKSIKAINNDSVVIIKHITSLLKGKIEMDIQEDTGSMIIIQLPIQ